MELAWNSELFLKFEVRASLQHLVFFEKFDVRPPRALDIYVLVVRWSIQNIEELDSNSSLFWDMFCVKKSIWEFCKSSQG